MAATCPTLPNLSRSRHRYVFADTLCRLSYRVLGYACRLELWRTEGFVGYLDRAQMKATRTSSGNLDTAVACHCSLSATGAPRRTSALIYGFELLFHGTSSRTFSSFRNHEPSLSCATTFTSCVRIVVCRRPGLHRLRSNRGLATFVAICVSRVQNAQRHSPSFGARPLRLTPPLVIVPGPPCNAQRSQQR